MGHRALVAYERIDGQYNLHYSHWGGLDLQCKHRISPATPFGAGQTTDWARDLHEELVHGCHATVLEDRLATVDRSAPLVDPQPNARGVSREAILTDHLDYLHHEAYFEVDTDLSVTAYRTLWFGLQFFAETITDDRTVGNGAVASLHWHEGDPVNDGYLRGRFQALKDVVADLLVDGGLGTTEAIQYMQVKLAEWIDDERDLRISPAATAEAARTTRSSTETPTEER